MDLIESKKMVFFFSFSLNYGLTQIDSIRTEKKRVNSEVFLLLSTCTSSDDLFLPALFKKSPPLATNYKVDPLFGMKWTICRLMFSHVKISKLQEVIIFLKLFVYNFVQRVSIADAHRSKRERLGKKVGKRYI